ncbi:MAG: ABC-2 type transport system permease protein [Flavobacteriales bacterium]|jgi:ABC-2 type transport system permease protein
MNSAYWISYKTIVRKEVRRFLRIWVQTLIPPAITMSLYFLIFGELIGSRIGQMGGHSYMAFVVPGLIMMSVINNAYSNVASSLYGAKFNASIEELLVSPTPNILILLGYVSGGALRGLLVGFIVTILALFFTELPIHSPLVMVLVVFLSAMLFSVAGFINAIYANSFDSISIVPTFILTPLTYLGGVFFTIDMLSGVWRVLSQFNPILYMVNSFRYGILGISDVSVVGSITGLFVLLIAGIAFALWAMENSSRLRR